MSRYCGRMVLRLPIISYAKIRTFFHVAKFTHSMRFPVVGIALCRNGPNFTILITLHVLLFGGNGLFCEKIIIDIQLIRKKE